MINSSFTPFDIFFYRFIFLQLWTTIEGIAEVEFIGELKKMQSNLLHEDHYPTTWKSNMWKEGFMCTKERTRERLREWKNTLPSIIPVQIIRFNWFPLKIAFTFTFFINFFLSSYTFSRVNWIAVGEKKCNLRILVRER